MHWRARKPLVPNSAMLKEHKYLRSSSSAGTMNQKEPLAFRVPPAIAAEEAVFWLWPPTKV